MEVPKVVSNKLWKNSQGLKVDFLLFFAVLAEVEDLLGHNPNCEKEPWEHSEKFNISIGETPIGVW